MQADALTLEEIALLEKRADRERRARREAEKILEAKSRELYKTHLALSEAQRTLRSQIKQLEVERDRVLSLSRFDLLTGLPNRTTFLSWLTRKLEKPKKPDHFLKLLLVDLRRFKHINNLVGQAGGDAVLKEVARRLGAVAAEHQGYAARFGGNEFALCLELKAGEAICRAEELRTTLSEPISVMGRKFRVDVCIGAAGTNVAEESVEALRCAAGFALVKSRENPNGGVCVFDADLQAEIVRRLDLEARLRQAIKMKEIEPWFQPIVNPSEPSTISFEVLARWTNHAEHISPGEFIPIAEEAGLRRRLDRYLLERSCTLARPWIEAGWVKDISVNVSPGDLVTPSFVEDLRDILDRVGFPRDRLVIEITESVFISDLDLARDRLHALNALGVKVALDDFGTGYSNLRSLVGLPLSKIKLDRSLISELNIDDRVAMLISTITQWARAIDIAIVAEGVETENQLTVLKALGCSSLQGYYFGKAQPADQISASFAPPAPMAVSAAVH